MDINRLTYLEKRYWAGESSLDEELELKNAFKNYPEGISEELFSLFKVIDRNIANKLDENFDSEFWNKVDTDNTGTRIFTVSLFLRYAAVGLIILGLTMAVWNNIINQHLPKGTTNIARVYTDTFDDPELAFEETKKALAFASLKLNKGKEPIKEIKRFYNVKVSIAGTLKDTTSVHTKKK